ncbi:hypothetical protein BDQ12DRAFT_679978 [Crucibulum laeve]|uniref:DNA-directed DNA polymerase X domain-containing protein n=1 Tax=Crucibulum laeve TaxID=68775 RepID=A0A5C3M607_9AGAR|nr:hypothetical protein BDQ12DRAFT_679978 [Crucibulum laeve]
MLSRTPWLSPCFRGFLFNSSSRCYATKSAQKPSLPTVAVVPDNQHALNAIFRFLHEEQQGGIISPYIQRAYNTTIRAVARMPRTLTAGEGVSKLSGPKALKSRLNAYLIETNLDASKPEGDYISTRSKAAIMEKLQNVEGIGPVKSKQLVELGATDISDLKSEPFNSVLTAPQRVGVKYHGRIHSKSTRRDVDLIRRFLEKYIPDFEVIPVGGYRRGLESFPSIELVFLHPTFVHVPTPTAPPPSKVTGRIYNMRAGYVGQLQKSASPLHTAILPVLHDIGFLADRLALTSNTCEFVCRLPGEVENWGKISERQEAIKNVEGEYHPVCFSVIPQRSRAAGLIYRTGDREFLNDVHARAARLKLIFNEHGLWRWHTKDDSEDDFKNGFWGLIKTQTEEDFFCELGMSYIPPEKRNFGFILGSRRK